VILDTPHLERERFSRDAAAKNLKPLWERMPRRPGSAAVPAIWRYAEVRPALRRAAELITVREAERRVLVLENPALSGTAFIAPSLFAGFQLILPGEVAPAHRHTPNALRFIVEGEGVYTTVDGGRHAMRPGDFVVTRSWAWHDHGNLGSEPVIWMDGLDSPLAQVFGAYFHEDYIRDTQSVAECERPDRQIRVYAWATMRERLEHLARNEPPHDSHGYKLRYVDDQHRDPIPTLAVFLQSLPGGFAGSAYRSTECSVFHVAEGRGGVKIGQSEYDFAPHDVFVVPSWTPFQLRAQADCVLFSYSDRAAQEALGFWREQP